MGWIKKVAKKEYAEAKRKVFGSKGITGRYGIGKGKGGFKIAKLAADIEAMKNRLNVEKKHKEADVETFTLGQVVGNDDGSDVIEVTPFITGGIDSDERIGRSLKLTGMSFPMSFTQQDHCSGDRKVRITLLRVRSADGGVSGTEARDTVWDQNPLTTVRDFNCPRSYRNSKNDGISVIRSMTCYVKGPQIGTLGTSITDQERQVKSIRFNVKMKDILRYANETDNVPEGLRYYLVFQCNSGNSSNGVSSTLDVPVQRTQSGLEVRLSQRSWWVDN